MQHLSSFSLDITDIAQTKKLGNVIAKHCFGGEIIYLTGNLGSGKTALTQYIAQALGVTKNVTSPTYLIVKEYNAVNNITLIHADMYRVNTIEDVLSTGILDDMGVKESVTIVEWSEKVKELEGLDHIHITIKNSKKRLAKVNIHSKSVSLSKIFVGIKNEYSIH